MLLQMAIFHSFLWLSKDSIFFKNTYLFIYLAASGLSCSMQTLSCGMHAGSSSLTRDRTLGPLHWESGVLATGPPGKSQDSIFNISTMLLP